jgi:hypothetical protein
MPLLGLGIPRQGGPVPRAQSIGYMGAFGVPQKPVTTAQSIFRWAGRPMAALLTLTNRLTKPY